MEDARRIEQAITDETLIDSLWEVYRLTFVDQPPESIERQSCYDEGTFRRIMSDPEYVKFIRLDDSGHVRAYLLATANLERLDQDYLFVDVNRLRVLFPKETDEGRLLYITSLASRPGTSSSVVELLTEYAVERKMMFAFDYSNEKHPGFPDYAVHQVSRAITARGLPSSIHGYQEIGAQRYGVITFDHGEDT